MERVLLCALVYVLLCSFAQGKPSLVMLALKRVRSVNLAPWAGLKRRTARNDSQTLVFYVRKVTLRLVNLTPIKKKTDHQKNPRGVKQCKRTGPRQFWKRSTITQTGTRLAVVQITSPRQHVLACTTEVQRFCGLPNLSQLLPGPMRLWTNDRTTRRLTFFWNDSLSLLTRFVAFFLRRIQPSRCLSERFASRYLLMPILNIIKYLFCSETFGSEPGKLRKPRRFRSCRAVFRGWRARRFCRFQDSNRLP